MNGSRILCSYVSAALDRTVIREWVLQCNGECPNCGRKFEDMNPAESLVPHWKNECKKQEKST